MTDLEKEVLRQIHELAHEVQMLRKRVSDMEQKDYWFTKLQNPTIPPVIPSSTITC